MGYSQSAKIIQIEKKKLGRIGDVQKWPVLMQMERWSELEKLESLILIPEDCNLPRIENVDPQVDIGLH